MTYEALDQSLTNLSRKMHSLDIVYPRVAQLRKSGFVHLNEATALADLVRERATALLAAADLLRHEAELAQEARKAVSA